MKKRLLELKRQGILDALSEGIVDLQFKKVSGDLRNMRGTRKFDLIPEDKHPKTEDKREQNETIVVLYDLEVNDWRSFRIENLIEYRCDAWQ
jgi:hypothetical protein